MNLRKLCSVDYAIGFTGGLLVPSFGEHPFRNLAIVFCSTLVFCVLGDLIDWTFPQPVEKEVPQTDQFPASFGPDFKDEFRKAARRARDE